MSHVGAYVQLRKARKSRASPADRALECRSCETERLRPKPGCRKYRGRVDSGRAVCIVATGIGQWAKSRSCHDLLHHPRAGGQRPRTMRDRLEQRIQGTILAARRRPFSNDCAFHNADAYHADTSMPQSVTQSANNEVIEMPEPSNKKPAELIPISTAGHRSTQRASDSPKPPLAAGFGIDRR